MRAIIVVIDGFGVGEAPDAKLYDSVGTNSFGNLSKKVLVATPNLDALGLKDIDGQSFEKKGQCKASFGRMLEKSKHNSSLSAHFELAGMVFDHELTDKEDEETRSKIKSEIEKEIFLETLCGEKTDAAESLGKYASAHVDTRFPILFFGPDNSLQICLHEKKFRESEIEMIGEKARNVCAHFWEMGKVKVRIFAGEIGKYYMTQHVKVFNILPNQNNFLKMLKSQGKDVIGIGKIEELFSNAWLTKSYPARTNDLGEKLCLKEIEGDTFSEGVIFVNLQDTDFVFGHKNDYLGYRDCLERIDRFVGQVMEQMKGDDVLFVCSDHGNDPTLTITHHTREYVPLLIYGQKIKSNNNLGTISSLAAVGDTISDMFGMKSGSNSLRERIEL